MTDFPESAAHDEHRRLSESDAFTQGSENLQNILLYLDRACKRQDTTVNFPEIALLFFHMGSLGHLPEIQTRELARKSFGKCPDLSACMKAALGILQNSNTNITRPWFIYRFISK